MTDSLEIQRILALARKSNASDIHIVANLPPLFRINGEIILADSPPLCREDTKRMCYSLMNDEQVKIFEDEWQICCSVYDKNFGRFRVSIYYQSSSPEMALRPVMDHIQTREELSLPAEIEDLTRISEGLRSPRMLMILKPSISKARSLVPITMCRLLMLSSSRRCLNFQS